MSHDGSSEEVRLPENYVPSDGDLISIVSRQQQISLRELCAEVWPGLPWTAPCGRASAVGVTREWPLQLGPGSVGNRSIRLTAACYLMDRMQGLVIRGV